MADFHYPLPAELIAQHPAPGREDSRLMVVDRRSQALRHVRFGELPRFLAAHDLLVLNNSRVFPARLFASRRGKRERLEILLLRRLGRECWEALVKPGRKARPGDRLVLVEDGCEAVVVAISDSGARRLEFHCRGDFWKWVEELGQTPLPPYIDRPLRREDREWYQTVFARVSGSVAAPTAGLHFTPRLLQQLSHCEITLHVGYGTFKPISSDSVEQHRMDPEYYEVKDASAQRIQKQLQSGKRLIAVGTTTTRVLEHVYSKHGRMMAESGWTDLFIYPGFNFQATGGLITNFHLPESTLLLLVSAFAGTDLIRHCYAEAIRRRYRFYSYGDAMLIL